MGEMITVEGDQPLEAYLARPEGPVKGGIIVIHEVWGLVDHTKSVADRFATNGYLALAPDFLSHDIDVASLVGLQEDLFNPQKRNEVQPILRQKTAPMQSPEFGEKTIKRLKDCFNYLYNLDECNQSVAVIGFCFGGTYSFALAVEEPRLKIAIPFYGHSDHELNDLKRIKCPVRAFYGEDDERLISGLDNLRQKMQEAAVDFSAKVYPNCGHAFFNDTNRFAYNAEAAQDAWQLSLEFLAKAI